MLFFEFPFFSAKTPKCRQVSQGISRKWVTLYWIFFFFLLPLWSSFKSRSYNQGSYNQPSQDWPITNYMDNPVNQSKLSKYTKKRGKTCVRGTIGCVSPSDWIHDPAKRREVRKPISFPEPTCLFGTDQKTRGLWERNCSLSQSPSLVLKYKTIWKANPNHFRLWSANRSIINLV